MDDRQIIELFLAREERAIAELQQKYGGYCRAIAYRILGDARDAEEIENDCYLKVWNAIPPNEPDPLSSYVSMICRRTALSRAEAASAQKRGGGQLPAVLDELESVLSAEDSADFDDAVALRDALNRFLRALPQRQRNIFLQRYWYFRPIGEIAAEFSTSESSVSVTLHRIRKKLKDFLEKEGFDL